MDLILYKYKCANCGSSFKEPELLDESYGDFILRSESGDLAYLLAIDSKVFSEIRAILSQNHKLNTLESMYQPPIVKNIFSIACDLSPDGTQYKIGRFPRCPNCHLNKMASWGPTNPPEFVEMDIKPVTHVAWNKLSNEEKKIMLDKAVDDYFGRLRSK